MNYEITLRGNKKITIDEEECGQIKKTLNKVKLYNLKSGIILNSADIMMIEPLSQPVLIPKKYQLPEDGKATSTEQEKELRILKTIGRMEQLFNLLKSKGLFKDFGNYQKWTERKTA